MWCKDQKLLLIYPVYQLEGFYISAGTSIKYFVHLVQLGKALVMVEYFVSGLISKASNGLEIWIQIRATAL